ncbi:MAG: rhodanese-like domain-containing protein [Oscillospiraceae bacterium]|nr:rhodanese-like domain-containing protein [Oscillospiraceae bacterium]
MIKRRIIIIFTVFLVLFLITCCNKSESNPDISEIKTETPDISDSEKSKKIEYIKITQQEAYNMMTGEVIILDVRTQEEFDDGHILNAVLLPDYEIEEKAESLIPGKNQIILVYCRTGVRSANASKKLIDMGYTKVFDFGGIVDWEYKIVTDIDYTTTMKINGEMPEFEFRLEGIKERYSYSEIVEAVYISKMTISGKDGSFKQEFTDLSTEIYTSKKDIYGLSFDDWNFDGYLDISLWQSVGGTMGNSPHYYWLWDNNAGLFIENKQLEEISDYSTISIIDTDGKNQITNFVHVGYEGDGIGYWEYTKGEYIHVKSKSVEWLHDDSEYIYHVIIEELIDGEMIITEDYFSNDYDEVYEN